MPTVLVLTAIILGLLLRSVVAALYLLVAVTLNYFAALGAASFLFYRIQGDDGIAYAIPLYAFIFLVALGADYTIFLMSRVREEVGRHGTRIGTQDALRRTGGVITSAGLILAGTFLVLTTLPLRELYQLGVVVALGVLLDTFVVRGLLVPGIVILLGRWNWWPGGSGPAAPRAGPGTRQRGPRAGVDGVAGALAGRRRISVAPGVPAAGEACRVRTSSAQNPGTRDLQVPESRPGWVIAHSYTSPLSCRRPAALRPVPAFPRPPVGRDPVRRRQFRGPGARAR